MLKKLFLSGFVLILVVLSSITLVAQTYHAVADGLWSDPNTWSSTHGGTPGTGAGNGFPEAGSIAFTDGFQISVDQDVTVANLGIRSTNGASGQQLIFGGLFSPFTITITNLLAGSNTNLPNHGAAAPTESVIEDNSNLIFRFTRNSGDIISNWSYLAPINYVQINPTTPLVTPVQTPNNAGGSLAVSGILEILSGTFQPRRNLADGSGFATIQVAAGTTLNLGIADVTGDGTLGTKFYDAQVSGTVTIGPARSLTTENITLASTGQLNVGFNGINQTQGWWYQNNGPSGDNLDPLSTVTYNADAGQTVAAGVTYGNLSLTSSSSAVKTLTGSGLTIHGNLTVDANVNSSAASAVRFEGTTAQTISGDGTLNFDGGITVNKASNTLTLDKSIGIAGNLTMTSGTLTSGTSSTVTVTGTSSFTGAGSVTLNNLVVSGTGSLTINSTTLSLIGDLTNNGSLTSNTSSIVTFSGGAAQAIAGSPFSLGNMVVNKPSAILSNNNTGLNLLRTLTMTDGEFDADGDGSGIFILNSDVLGDARIAPISASSSVSGEVTFERFFNNTLLGQPSQWRNFGFPVTSVDYSELGALGLQPNSLATYTESVAGDVDQGWVFPTGGTLNSDQGHTAWMYSGGPTTLSIRGPLVHGTLGAPHNYSLTFTNNGPASDVGWNFIPNPYPSPIDWNSASGWSKTNLAGVAVVWDQENNVYQTAGTIAQGQGFWVQAASGGVLTSTEAVKIADSNPDFLRVANIEKSKVFISLKSGPMEDVTTIQFRKDATEEHDLPFDCYKFKNGIYNLSSLTKGGANLMVNVLPETRCGSSIKLNITNIEPGTYSFSIKGMESFDNLQSITLTDKFTKKSQVVEPDGVYSFDVTSDPSTFGSERFQLEFEFTDQTPNPVISKEGNRLTSSSLTGNQWYMNDLLIEGATGRSFVPSVHGDYHVRVQDGRCNVKSEVIPIIDGINRIFPNPASEWLKVDVYHLAEDGLPGKILIHSTQGQLIRDESFTSKDGVKDIDIMDVKPGSYIVTVVSGTGVILEKSKVVIK